MVAAKALRTFGCFGTMIHALPCGPFLAPIPSNDVPDIPALSPSPPPPQHPYLPSHATLSSSTMWIWGVCWALALTLLAGLGHGAGAQVPGPGSAEDTRLFQTMAHKRTVLMTMVDSLGFTDFAANSLCHFHRVAAQRFLSTPWPCHTSRFTLWLQHNTVCCCWDVTGSRTRRFIHWYRCN